MSPENGAAQGATGAADPAGTTGATAATGAAGGPRLAEIGERLAPLGLAVCGGFHPGPRDGAPKGMGTLLLVGADGERLWPVFAAAPEHSDGVPDPLDRWSRRVLTAVAAGFGGRAVFPFEGPPYPPFIAWAARGEHSRPSPVRLPVSPVRGLWASYRGALALPGRLELPLTPATDPCLGCPAPCLTACPVVALTASGYDVDACVAHVGDAGGTACRLGCLVRRACPVGEAPPLPQRRFHMDAFVAVRRRGR